MTIKKAIGIGLLGATIIGLVAFGIKTNSFNKENLRPKTLTHSKTPIQVNADDILPISTKWLFNKEQPKNSSLDITTNFTTWLKNSNLSTLDLNAQKTNCRKIYKSNSSTYFWNMSYYVSTTEYKTFEYVTGTTPTWTVQSERIVEFETQPTGSLYTYLNQNAQPAYNNDILMINNSNRTHLAFTGLGGLQQLRKSNIIIENEQLQNGTFINESAPITLYLDAGITHLYINGTDYINNLDSVLNITNNDIIIASQGTTTGQFYKTFTINYFNTRPAIEPKPYPDASGKVTEIVDIRGLMLQILTMPFTFITQAFDVTLWPNTQYEFNISNFIIAIISIASILFIIKLFTSGFSIIGNYTGNRVDTRLKKSQIEYNKAKTDLAHRTDPNTKTRINKKEK